MRLALLILAAFYAWLPSGLCACKLQAALFPPARNASDQMPLDPVDDDDEGPYECHCSGAKPLCVVADTPCLEEGTAATLDAVSEVSWWAPQVDDHGVSPIQPFYHALQAPLYLMLRALRI
jgi:hypothetical protein